MRPARPRGPLNPAYRTLAVLVKPFVSVATKSDWRGWENLPREGGFVAAPNHLSMFDPFDIALYLYESGCVPYFLGKEEVFRTPGVGSLLRASGQVPVYRASGRAVDAFDAAVEAVAAGKCVVVFPEGTLTRDPDLWPMAGKTGAARIALGTRLPLIPMAHWGPQEVLPTYGRGLRLLPRKTMRVVAGPAVDLTDLYDQPITAAVLREATARLMGDITGLLEGLRGASAPSERWDPRAHGQAETGNFLKAAPSPTERSRPQEEQQ